MSIKFFCRIKSIITILLILITVNSYQNIYAKDNKPTSMENGNTIYRLIRNHEYILVPLADAFFGLSTCGPWCAIGGTVLGFLDEGMIYWGYADKHSFSYMLMGGATGNMMNPTLTNTGILVGGYVAGAFNEYPELLAPAISLTLGTQLPVLRNNGLQLFGHQLMPHLGGQPIGLFGRELAQILRMDGIDLGLCGALMDGILRQMGITKYNPITTTWIIPKLIKEPLVLHPLTSIFISIGLNTVIYSDFKKVAEQSIKADDLPFMPHNQGAINASRVLRKLYEHRNELIPHEEFSRHLEKNIISLAGSQFFIHWLFTKQLFFRQELEYMFHHADQAGLLAAHPYMENGIKFAIFIIPWVATWSAGQLAVGGIEKYFDDRLTVMLKDNINGKLYANENLLRLSRRGDFSLYMNNLNKDISTITNLGSSVFGDAISSLVGGTYATKMIIIHSRNMLAYSALYELAMGKITQYLASKSLDQEQQIKLLRSELLDLYKDTKDNIRTLTEGDSLIAYRDKSQELSTGLIEIEGIKSLWDMALRLLGGVNGMMKFATNFYLVSCEIATGNLDFNQRGLLYQSMNDEVKMLSLVNRNILSVGQIEQSLDRIIVIEGIINGAPSDEDIIDRVYKEQNQLVLRNLEVGIGDRTLVTIDNLALDMGKIYAIIGDTGCGKSSLLSKIKGIKENGIRGKGTIYYPKINGKKAKIVMLSQQDYLPTNNSLLEILFYPESISDDPQVSKEQRVTLSQ